MDPSSPPPVLDGLVVEAVEWLPSGAEAGLVRVRGRWAEAARGEAALPELGVRRGGEVRQFESLPDARFGRDPSVWRGTYLVPAGLMAGPGPELWLSWPSGARSGLPAPDRGFEPPAPPEPAPAAVEPEADTGGEVIDRAVMAERRARRAEAAEREQARRAAEALKALEVLELRSSELERRLEALQSAPPPAASEPPAPVEVPVADPALVEALTAAVADVRRLRGELDEQRSRRRKAELLRAADAVALAAAQREQARAAELETALAERTVALADAVARAEQAAEQVGLARARAAADAAEVRARASSAEEALGEARAELDRLRAAHAEATAAAEERAHDLASIGAELARVRGELEEVRADAAGRVDELERRLAALDAQLAEERRARVAAGAELEVARAGAGVAEASRRAETVARAALEAELDRERTARATVAQALDAARAELAAVRAGRAEIVLAREEARAELVTARGAADGAEASLAAARAQRDTAVDAHREALAELAALRPALEAAQADAAAVRSAYDAAAADATAVRSAFAAVQEDSTAVRAALEAAHGEIAALTASRDAAQRALDDLEAERDEAAKEALALHEEFATLRDELAAATAGHEEPGAVMARIAELEAAAGEDLAARAVEQAAAAEAAEAARAEAPADDVAARFDAAAAALRESAPAAEADDSSAAASDESAPAAAPDESAPAAAPARPAPPIIDQAGHGARADLTGSSQRDYPWLRGTIVKLAHDDPLAAARLLLQLVPAQSALLQEPLEYDLTIRELGTHAVSAGEGRASAAAIERPRMRSEAEFHAAADALTLAELLAGVPKRIGRWRGPVRVNGRRRGAESLRDLLAGADLSLAEAARAGAALEPDLVFRLFAYAIQPAWTKGHAFTVAQEVDAARWLVTVADGAPVAVGEPSEDQPADAIVVMTRAAFDRLLRDEPAAAGELPAIRGDRAAVATLKAWTDRAQGR